MGSVGLAPVGGRAKTDSWSTPAGIAVPSHFARAKVADSAPATTSMGALTHICALIDFATRASRGECLDRCDAPATAGVNARDIVTRENAAIGTGEQSIRMCLQRLHWCTSTATAKKTA